MTYTTWYQFSDGEESVGISCSTLTEALEDIQPGEWLETSGVRAFVLEGRRIVWDSHDNLKDDVK